MNATPTQNTRRTYRVLIVEDDVPNWAQQMVELLAALQGDSALEVTCTIAANALKAERDMMSGHFHLVSLDMLIPDKAGEMKVTGGIDLARAAFRSGALVSKLLVYSSFLARGSEDLDASAKIHSDLPNLDRYAKTASTLVESLASVEHLTQEQWARRVLEYLSSESITLSGSNRAARRTVIGHWLDTAPKHLPMLLARHAQSLANAWEDPGAVNARFDAAVRFIETTTRLALLQTQVLVAAADAGQIKPSRPNDARISTCLQVLNQLLKNHVQSLAQWSWANYLVPAMPALDEARLLRNEDRHSLSPGMGKAGWLKIRPLLQAAMDLSAYWALHPIWTELRFNVDGWTGERLAGNAWPRPRRKVEMDGKLSGAEVRGGAWQTAVKVDGAAPSLQLLDWSDWLRADNNQRAWWFVAYQEQRGSRLVNQWLDLDSGSLQGEVASG